MATADRADPAPSESTPTPKPRKILCAVYGAIAVAALAATWGPNLAYTPDRFMSEFMNDLSATPASRSYAGDLLLLALAAVVFMVVEARRHHIKFVWLYVVGGFVTAIGCTFPLFLIARELCMGSTDTPRLRARDVVPLVVVAVLIAVHVVWIGTR